LGAEAVVDDVKAVSAKVRWGGQFLEEDVPAFDEDLLADRAALPVALAVSPFLEV
jgi:hypothetical protein